MVDIDKIYPNKDSPRYLAGFVATCAILVVCLLSYLTLPLWLLREAKIRKKKTGHAMPLRAMEDAEQSHVSAATLARIHEVTALEEKAAVEEHTLRKGIGPVHVEHVEKANI